MVKKLKLGKLTPIFEFLTKNLKNRTISTFFLFFFFFFFLQIHGSTWDTSIKKNFLANIKKISINTYTNLGHFYKKISLKLLKKISLQL